MKIFYNLTLISKGRRVKCEKREQAYGVTARQYTEVIHKPKLCHPNLDSHHGNWIYKSSQADKGEDK